MYHDGPGDSDGPGGPGRPELCENVREAPPKMLSSSFGQCLFGGGLGHLRWLKRELLQGGDALHS